MNYKQIIPIFAMAIFTQTKVGAECNVTLADNMEEVELDRLIQELDENEELTRFAFADVNPALVESLSSKDRKLQKLHLKNCVGFSHGERQPLQQL